MVCLTHKISDRLGVCAVTPEDEASEVFGTVADLVAKIAAVKDWDMELSPHWEV
jgi:hypothetical protein